LVNQPLLSIVITSYTTERLKEIYQVLDSVKNQTYTNVEIVFVTEKLSELKEIVEKYAEENDIPNVRVFHNFGKSGLSIARNLGIQHSKGDIIAFTDDDVILFPDWAEKLVKSFKDSTIIGVTGPAIPIWEDESMSWLPREFYWIISCSAWSEWEKVVDVRNTWGMNMAFRREAFTSGIEFSPDIGGIHGKRLHSEEVDLSQRIKRQTNKRIVFDPNVQVQHTVCKYRLTTRYIAKTSYWIGYTRQGLKKAYPEDFDGGNLLSTEYHLLKNIATRLPIDIIKSLFSCPHIAWKKFKVSVVSLSFVAWGYSSYWFQGHSKAKSHMQSE